MALEEMCDCKNLNDTSMLSITALFSFGLGDKASVFDLDFKERHFWAQHKSSHS